MVAGGRGHVTIQMLIVLHTLKKRCQMRASSVRPRILPPHKRERP
ncbi:hypothetical protein NA66_102473 [Burkholderia pyrrocinia]|uniref:Uncharacterized protein n=1 Tax=Burkholderia pyrrocinia TaxID=60550 RepID=A0A318I6F3_BURPY|nr:hypothetical protein NA66_102473 [Burkholderia pyrrocinia]SFW13336.1 hypothetical protein SAMN03159384_00073 [Burkholderia sp. NFACC33-1]SFX01193.1 hypothetical protein SAMN03159408_00074 [Burkholderia sp. NFPP32]